MRLIFKAEIIKQTLIETDLRKKDFVSLSGIPGGCDTFCAMLPNEFFSLDRITPLLNKRTDTFIIVVKNKLILMTGITVIRESESSTYPASYLPLFLSPGPIPKIYKDIACYKSDPFSYPSTFHTDMDEPDFLVFTLKK